MQAKWDEMFGVKEEEVVEEVKVKKPRKRTIAKKAVEKNEKPAKKKERSSAKKLSVEKDPKTK